MLPPAVAGIGAARGVRRGRAARRRPARRRASCCRSPSGRSILAITFVASPFYLRQAIAAFEAVDPTLVDAARTLGAAPAADVPGASRCRSPRRAWSPAGCWPSRAASASSARRSSSPATSRGETQTLTLAIYEQLEADLDVALAIGVLLVVLSAAVLLSYKLLVAWRRSSSTSARASRLRARRRADVGAETLALVGPVGRGQDDGAARGRRPAHARDAAGSRSATTVWFDTARRRRPRRPSRRSVGLVLQDYALFPHLTRRAQRRLRRPRRAGRRPAASGSASPHLAGERPDGSPAASASASRSPARSRATRPSCCSTSRSPRSTPTRARRVRDELRDLLAELRDARRCSSPTTSRDAAALADRVAMLVAGRVRQIGTAPSWSSARRRLRRRFTGAVLLDAASGAAASGGSRVALDGGGELRAATVAAGACRWRSIRGRSSSRADGDLVRTVSALAPA